MKDLDMEIEWRTIQFFIGEEGISEVEIDHENRKKVRCTCALFSKRGGCPHAQIVRKEMDENFGHYTIAVPEYVEDEEAFNALSDPDNFRDFILKYGKVKVLGE
jgi:hypothetical protein